MGLFDHYVPDPPLVCPVCNTVLDGWQGKDGPCMQLTWKQGAKIPVAHIWPDECVPKDEIFFETFVLPRHFQIYTDECICQRTIEAYGICNDEIWLQTEIVTHLNFRPGPTTSKKDELRIQKDLQKWIESNK